jgi:oligogalacturonide lyase
MAIAAWTPNQYAMLSENKRSLNICVVPVPEAWLKRSYPIKIQ